MMRHSRVLVALLLLAGCTSAPQPTSAPAPQTPPSALPPAGPDAVPPQAAKTAPAPRMPAWTMDGYKKVVAGRIVKANADLQADSLPPMLRSIVVLNLTIDRHGNLAEVSVRRSNGFKQLENRAMESVKRAAPFDAPGTLVHRGDTTVSFLETFLFRDDGRYQVRSLQN
jgi:protein TonB